MDSRIGRCSWVGVFGEGLRRLRRRGRRKRIGSVEGCFLTLLLGFRSTVIHQREKKERKGKGVSVYTGLRG